MSISELIAQPFILKILLRALTVGLLVSVCAALLGVSLVLKRYSMIGDGLSHVGFGALAVATALDLSGEKAIEISIPIVVAAAFMLLKLSQSSRIKGDAAIALISTASMAVGVIIYDRTTGMSSDVCSSLFGQSSAMTITDKDLILSVCLTVAVAVLFLLFYNRIFCVTFDEAFAKASGLRSGRYNIILALLTAVTVVIGMRMLGALMISALVVFPPLTAMRLFKSFKSVVAASAAVSASCFIIGFIIASFFGLQTGPAVILVNLAAMVFKEYISAFVADKTLDALMATTSYVDDEKPLWVSADDEETTKEYQKYTTYQGE